MKNIKIKKLYSLSLILLMFSISIGPAFYLLWDPSLIHERFNQGSLLVYFSLILLVIIGLLTGDLFKAIFKYKSDFWILLCLILTLSLSSILYENNIGDINFNFKLLVLVNIYLLLKHILFKYPNLKNVFIFSISISSGLIAIIYTFLIKTKYSFYSSGRFFMLGENPNSYSTRFVIGTILTLYILISNKIKQKNKFWLVLFLPFLLIQIYISGSRGSIVMLILGLLLLFFNVKMTFNKKLLSIFILILIIIIGSIFLPKIKNLDVSTKERLVETIKEKDTSGRTNIWGEAFELFLDKPLLGYGENGYFKEMETKYGEERDTHNLFLYLLCSGGLVGLLLFLVFIFSSFKLIWKNRKIIPLEFSLYFSLLFFVSKTGGVLTYIPLWCLLGFIAASKQSLLKY